MGEAPFAKSFSVGNNPDGLDCVDHLFGVKGDCSGGKIEESLIIVLMMPMYRFLGH